MNDELQFLALLEAKKKSGGAAAALNFFFPGAGYMYCGRFFLGIIAFFVTVVVAVVSLGFGMFFMVPILVVDGFLAAQRHNRQLATKLLAMHASSGKLVAG